jgi:conserved oligomeric Golgi complex subunit 6
MIVMLNNTCDEMRKHISASKQETGPMLEEATSLMAAKKETEAKQEILDALNKHFLLSDKDLSALTSSIEPVDDRFFAVLARVKKIHEDCEVLLESEDQILGMELMERTSRDLDAAFKKLYQWIQKELKTLDLEDPHISGSIRRALRVLAERPSLFQNCLDFFAEARERTLSDAFRIALTEAVGGSEGAGSAKPIEFSTHDLLRYLGDMLAWVHSCSVSEKESLEGLFISDGGELARKLKAGQDSEPWSRLRLEATETETGGESVFDGQRALNDLVNRNLTGISHTLSQRIEIAVRNNDDAVVVYKALHLLRFYHDIFSKLLGPTSGLAETVKGLATKTFDHFEHILQDEADNSGDQSLPSDLSVPTVLTIALDRLGMLLRSVTDASAVSEIDRLLSVALTPFLATCEEMAEDIPNPMQRAIFRLNQGLIIRSSPEIAQQIAETSTIMQEVAAGTTALMSELTNLQHDFLLRESGLRRLLDSTLFVESVPSTKAEEAEDDVVEISIEMLQDVAAKLDAFLPNAQMDALENLKNLVDKHVAKEITEAAIQMFCDDFEQVEQAIEEHDDEEEVDREESAAENEQMEKPALERIPQGSIEVDEQGQRKGILFGPYFQRTTMEVRVLLS